MLDTKSGFLERFFTNTLITSLIAYISLKIGLFSLSKEIGEYDLVIVLGILFLGVPLLIELIIWPLERMFLVKLLTLGFFGLIARMAVWGATLWYVPEYFSVYHNNFQLSDTDGLVKFLCLIAFLTIVRFRKKG